MTISDLLKRKAALAAALICVTGLLSCGDFTVGPQAKSGSASETGIVLQWPEGFSYDGSTARLTGPAEPGGLSAPSYVTAVTLTITGADLEPIKKSVPLDTLRTTVKLTLGERKFSVLVETNIGKTFTGAVTLKIGPGFAGPIVIPLEINASPVIHRVTPSTEDPLPGESVVVTAEISDPDPNDTLSIRWFLHGPRGTKDMGSGLSITIPPQEEYGTYTLELKVDDGHGGTARWTRTVTVVNPVKISRVDISNTMPQVGDDVIFTAVVDSVPAGVSLTYDWIITDPNGTTTYDSGADFTTVTIAYVGTYSVTVIVKDQYGNPDQITSTVGGDCATPAAPTALTAAAHTSVNGGAQLSWTGSAGADFYKVLIYNNLMALQQIHTPVYATTSVEVGPVGQIGYFQVKAACGTVESGASNTAGPVTYPGVLKPLKLAQTGATAGSIPLYWETDTTTPATGYTLSWTDNLNNSGSASGATAGSVCPGVTPWNGAGTCMSYGHVCTTGRTYTYTVTETDGTYTSASSASYTYACP